MAAEDHKVGFEATTSSIKDMFTTLNATYDGKRDRKALIIASDRGEPRSNFAVPGPARAQLLPCTRFALKIRVCRF